MNSQLFVELVFVCLVLDNILLTMIVPILPEYLLQMVAHAPQSGATTNDASIRETDQPKHLKLLHIIAQARTHEIGIIGVMLSSHGMSQMMFNSIVARIINKYGSFVPLIIGTILLFGATIVYTLANHLLDFFVARVLHGISSAFLIISAMSLMATVFVDEQQRAQKIGISMSGIAVGVLIGYPFGSMMYCFVGKPFAFTCLAFFILLLIAAELWLYKNLVISTYKTFDSRLGVRTLSRDLDVLNAIASIGLTTTCIAMLEPCLPSWLMSRFHPSKWQLGLVFIPDSIGYLIGTSLFGKPALTIGRLLMAKIALLLVGFSAISIPNVANIGQLIVPHFALGLGIGIMDSTMVPHLAYIVDQRYSADYATVYGVSQIAVCFAYGIAPLIGSQLAQLIGFQSLMIGLGTLNILHSLLIAWLESRSYLSNELGQSSRPSRCDPSSFRHLPNESATSSKQFAIDCGSSYNYDSIE